MAFDATTYEINPLTLTTPRARLEYLRDFLRRLPKKRFNMADAGDLADADRGYCDTAACIGGWGRALFAVHDDIRKVGAVLGLSKATTNELFYPAQSFNLPDGRRWAPICQATPTEAATVLDHLLNTGEVDWSVARKVGA